MIQDIAPKHLYNEYQPRNAQDEDLVFAFIGNSFLGIRKEGKLVIPTVADLAKNTSGLDVYDSAVNLTYLFRIDDQGYFLAFLPDDFELTGFDWLTTHEFRSANPKDLCYAGMTAYHLYLWYRNHIRCGRCGKKMKQVEEERAMQCTVCGNRVYPFIAPAVIVAVTDGDRILATRYAGRDYKGFALVAGFCEIGETAEETVVREVMEEVGVKVKNIRYYKSQPWGIASNLLLGYFCDLDGDARLNPDLSELAMAKWIEREDIPDFSDEDLSLTLEMIELFRTGNYPQ